MRQLNSVLIEGTIVNYYTMPNGAETHTIIENISQEGYKTTVRVIAREGLAEKMHGTLCVGRSIRAVGRLIDSKEHYGESEFSHVLAEHIELRTYRTEDPG